MPAGDLNASTRVLDYSSLKITEKHDAASAKARQKRFEQAVKKA